MSIVSIAPCSWAIFCSSVMASTSFSARSRGVRDVSCQAYVVLPKLGPPPVAVGDPPNIERRIQRRIIGSMAAANAYALQ